jgi:hypothetical protein
MARRGWNLLVPILVVVLFAMPVAARDAAKNGKATTADVDIFDKVSIAGKQLKPGMYHISADDTTVTLSLDGKVVAQAPVEWKDETSKPRQCQILSRDSQVKEIHFGGKMRYIAITG